MKLKQMNKKTYKAFIAKSIKRFAKDGVKSGYWSEGESIKEAKRFYAKNAFTKKSYLFYTIRNTESKVLGYLWLIKERKALYIAEIYIRKKHRQKGYAQETLAKVEKLAHSFKYKKVELTVSTHNTIAKSLYTKCAYHPSSEYRVKKI